MSNYLTPPLDWRVVYLSVFDKKPHERPAVVARFNGEAEATRFAQDLAAGECGIAAVEELQAGAWDCNRIYWDRDFTKDAEAAVEKFSAAAQEVFAEEK